MVGMRGGGLRPGRFLCESGEKGGRRSGGDRRTRRAYALGQIFTELSEVIEQETMA
jgi:hypothetical protein